MGVGDASLLLLGMREMFIAQPNLKMGPYQCTMAVAIVTMVKGYVDI
jgi:hypothetical protein